MVMMSKYSYPNDTPVCRTSMSRTESVFFAQPYTLSYSYNDNQKKVRLVHFCINEHIMLKLPR